MTVDYGAEEKSTSTKPSNPKLLDACPRLGETLFLISSLVDEGSVLLNRWLSRLLIMPRLTATMLAWSSFPGIVFTYLRWQREISSASEGESSDRRALKRAIAFRLLSVEFTETEIIVEVSTRLGEVGKVNRRIKLEETIWRWNKL